MELTNDVYNSVNSYFSVLTHVGYKAYTEVDKLIIYCFLEELLSGPMAYYVTEEDYNIIMNSIECLYGTCLIPYPDYRRGVDDTVNSVVEQYRITESGVLRGTENSELRVKS